MQHARFVKSTYPLFLGGELREGSATETVTNPYDHSPVAEVSVGGASEMEQAMAIAAASFDTMRKLPTHERAAILERTARMIEERLDELAELMAREAGKPIRFCRGEVQRAVLTFTLAAGEARQAVGEVLPVDLEPSNVEVHF